MKEFGFFLVQLFLLTLCQDFDRSAIVINTAQPCLWRGPVGVKQTVALIGYSTLNTQTELRCFSASGSLLFNRTLNLPSNSSLTLMGQLLFVSNISSIIVFDTQAASWSRNFSNYQFIISQGSSTENFTVFYSSLNSGGNAIRFISNETHLTQLEGIPITPRLETAVTSIGTYILFGGGIFLNRSHSDLVDIWDSKTTQLKISLRLADKRTKMTAVSNSRYSIFLGGIGATGSLSSRFEVFDSATTNWVTSNIYPYNFEFSLSAVAACSIGETFLFTGLQNNLITDQIHVLTLDNINNPPQRKVITLTEAKRNIAGISTPNACFFVGGETLIGSPVTNMEKFTFRSASTTTTTTGTSTNEEPISPTTWLIIVSSLAGAIFIVLVITVIAVLVIVCRKPKENQHETFKPKPIIKKPSEMSTKSTATRAQYINFREMQSTKPSPMSYYTGPQLSGVKIFEPFAEGHFSVAYGGEYKQQLVCVKKLKEDEQNVIDSMKEAELLWQLRHPHVVRLLGVFVDPAGGVSIVNEMMNKGDLKSYIAQFPDTPYHMKVNMALQAVNALAFLEKNKIVHKDVALRNLLLSVDEHSFYVKLSDFGLARRTIGGTYISLKAQIVVATKWAAPEVLNASVFSSKSDVYSFGITLWELFTGDTPYSTATNDEASDLIRSKSLLHIPSYLPLDLKQTMSACWTYVAASRPSFAEVNTSLSSLQC